MGAKENISYTLNTIDRHCVAYMGYKGFGDYKESEVSKALMCSDDITTGDLILTPRLANTGQVTGPLLANAGTKLWQGNQEAFSGDYSVIQNYQVRRLTPLECERLQGFADGWTSGHSDSARYKALGNSVAVPCVFYVMGGLYREFYKSPLFE